MDNALGLVMTGGGARGAYQAGVLARLGELKRTRVRGCPFPIIGGSSAGAINGCAVAAGSDDFSATTSTLSRSLLVQHEVKWFRGGGRARRGGVATAASYCG